MIPKHLLINFDQLKVGQRVWTIHTGYTDIVELQKNDNYPIKLKSRSYCFDGREYLNHEFPSLFLDCPFIEEERVVEVSSYEDFRNPEKRVLHQIKNGQFLCWCYTNDLGESNKAMNVHPWPFMRELQPEPIKEKIKVSKQDIAKLMGCGVEEIEIV